jgi:hypothetical protein
MSLQIVKSLSSRLNEAKNTNLLHLKKMQQICQAKLNSSVIKSLTISFVRNPHFKFPIRKLSGGSIHDLWRKKAIGEFDSALELYEKL